MSYNCRLNILDLFNILIEVTLIFFNRNVDLFNIWQMTCTDGQEFRVQIIGKVLQHTFDLVHHHLLNFLFNRRSSESQDMWAFAVFVARSELMVKEVPHYQVVEVVLVCMVALIKDNQRNFFHFDEAVHK